ncbi:MAG: site-2 protease family protein [Pirellulales bacterium]|nr:site-2 protease family protein [Pirellulales bacterium]
MIFAEPPPSPYDLRFRAFGFPVRVHPYFWLVAGLLGIGFGRKEKEVELADFMIWVAVMFASILVHELGHAFAQRHFGGRPWITLHAMGGLASCDDCDRSPRSQIFISLAGPIAGFAVALAAVVLLRGTGHVVGYQFREDKIPSAADVGALEGLRMLGGTLYWNKLANPRMSELVGNVFWLNILWGVVNLLPIYPLDGGRVSRELCTLAGNPRDGIILSLRISIVAAAAMAAVGIVAWGSLFTAVLFGSLAYSNYQTLQAYSQHGW